jgi:hypothetical protein
MSKIIQHNSKVFNNLEEDLIERSIIFEKNNDQNIKFLEEKNKNLVSLYHYYSEQQHYEEYMYYVNNQNICYEK